MLSDIDIKHYREDNWLQPKPEDKSSNWPQPTVSKKAEGLKYDNDKPPIALVDPEFIEGLAKVLGFGAAKYSPDNWRNGIHYRRLISAAYRHLGAINKGEDIDSESGLPHAYHLACCNMFLASMMNHRPDMDDRWKGK